MFVNNTPCVVREVTPCPSKAWSGPFWMYIKIGHFIEIIVGLVNSQDPQTSLIVRLIGVVAHII